MNFGESQEVMSRSPETKSNRNLLESKSYRSTVSFKQTPKPRNASMNATLVVENSLKRSYDLRIKEMQDKIAHLSAFKAHADELKK
jgi:hypothetical protein